MMSSLFVKVDCRWEEAAHDGRISLTVLRPVRSPLSQPTSKHLPCTTHPGSGTNHGWAAPGLAAAAAGPARHTDTQTHRQARSRPLPTYPSKPTRKLPPICVIPRSYRPRRIYRSLHKKHLIALQSLRLSLLSPTDTPPGSPHLFITRPPLQFSPQLSPGPSCSTLLYSAITTAAHDLFLPALKPIAPQSLSKNGCPRRSVPQVRRHRRR